MRLKSGWAGGWSVAGAAALSSLMLVIDWVPAMEPPSRQARQFSDAFRAASERVVPAVVKILAVSAEADPILDMLDLLEEDDDNFSIGSGVIIRADGLLLTNAHVVEGARRTLVQLSDGRRLPARDARLDTASDVAILWVDSPEPLPTAQLGSSSALEVGDWVLAIGCPFGFDATVSAGIISGKTRIMGNFLRGKLLQTDASINPGNSGGPLCDLDGEVVGINTAIATRTGGFQGVGFAIPIDRVKWIADQLEEHREVRRGILGVRTATLPQTIAAQLKLPISSGAYVTGAVPGRPAFKAGVAVGDLIVSLDGTPISSPGDLAERVERSPIGPPLVLEILRGGEPLLLEVQLEQVQLEQAQVEPAQLEPAQP